MKKFSNLYKTIPVILGLSSVTVRAHLISHYELHYKCLLQNCSTQHLSLNLQLDLESLAVWLCPQEIGINQLDIFQPLQFLKAESHQFSALQCCLYPLTRRLQISLTKSAELYCDLTKIGN